MRTGGGDSQIDPLARAEPAPGLARLSVHPGQALVDHVFQLSPGKTGGPVGQVQVQPPARIVDLDDEAQFPIQSNLSRVVCPVKLRAGPPAGPLRVGAGRRRGASGFAFGGKKSADLLIHLVFIRVLGH